MVTRRRFLGLLGTAGVTAVAVAAGAGCGPEEAAAEPAVRFGEEGCARCGMVIDDRRFAAAWIEPSGTERHYDDMVCALRDLAERSPGGGTRFFAGNYDTESWIDATSATYLVTTEVRTPMASGIVALSGRSAGEQLQAEVGGDIHDWASLGMVQFERPHGRPMGRRQG